MGWVVFESLRQFALVGGKGDSIAFCSVDQVGVSNGRVEKWGGDAGLRGGGSRKYDTCDLQRASCQVLILPHLNSSVARGYEGSGR